MIQKLLSSKSILSINKKPFVFIVLLFLISGVSLNTVSCKTDDNADQSLLSPPYFPDRLSVFIWRNWESVSAERMAKVLDTTPAKVKEIGSLMGLPKQASSIDIFEKRGYISLIRRNWHLLPYNQLLVLLDWDAEKLAFTIREDDFLSIKLGPSSLKPDSPFLKYAEPTESAKKQYVKIKSIISSHFGDQLTKPGEPRFQFVQTLSTVDKSKVLEVSHSDGNEPIRFLYSYFAVYGDPLMDLGINPFPDGLLQRLSEVGVNGVWIHTVLRQLAPSSIFSEFGKDHQIRLANLRKMVKQAKRYGIKIYLYMNEPRAMDEKFFEGRDDLKGEREGSYIAMCTSAPQVRQWITESLEYVFKNVSDLGGVFAITASENLTNCYCRKSEKNIECPRCSKRSKAEVLAEVNCAIAEGVRRGNPNAKMIVWDWGWPAECAEQIIKQLPKDAYLMSVSEWSKPFKRGGVDSAVGEYSISVVGPGPRALQHWSFAKKYGIKTIAKMQVNCTWELSAVPYLPVMNLVAEHCANLAENDVDGQMLSWTLGGSPSPNLQLVNQINQKPALTAQDALRTVAVMRYGENAAQDVLLAWSLFSQAFREYPFHIGFIYFGPAQLGVANPFYIKPTRFRATMVGFPYDDVKTWRAVYPAEIMAEQFEKVAKGWNKGLSLFEKALAKTKTPDFHNNAEKDFHIAQACYAHFKSIANQIRFILARDGLLSESVNDAQRKEYIEIIKAVTADEMQLAKNMFGLTKADSRIGYEATNQYYYLPLDFVEKVINCQYILEDWLPYIKYSKLPVLE